VQPLCIPLIEDYTEIFYVIDKGDNPSIQFKMSIRGPKSMRKVDGLSRIFIDFYVPVLTPRLNSSERSLQVSENIAFFARTSQKTLFPTILPLLRHVLFTGRRLPI
jgi:hypothetical protein